MRRFAQLTEELNSTTRTNEKRDALVRCLQDVADTEKVWIVALFTGRRPKRLVNSTLLKYWCAEEAELPFWLFEESYHSVGDLAESISLMLPVVKPHEIPSLTSLMLDIKRLQGAPEEVRKSFVLGYWRSLSRQECFVFNKIIIGGFRMGVSRNLVLQALSVFTQKPVQIIAHLLSGKWDPYSITFDELIDKGLAEADSSKPYPFYLAYPLEHSLQELGAPGDWQVEWKWDGIRGQMIRRSNKLFLWSRGEELITEQFPEFSSLIREIPDGVVIDGEVLSYKDGKPLPFQYLQTRISRKAVSKKQLSEAPVIFMAYDLLECDRKDLRDQPLRERRILLEQVVQQAGSDHLMLSPVVGCVDWTLLEPLMSKARAHGCEGFMLKRKSGAYQTGRKKGDWWKWKTEPLTVDAVLVYAQKGHGKRSGLYTDYTFAVKDGEHLVPFAKAYSGLTDKELASVDRFIKQNSLEQFGPVRTVKPELVFEIGFEGIARSGRHKSGVSVRFPRILRQRKDKAADEINTLEELKQLLDMYGK